MRVKVTELEAKTNEFHLYNLSCSYKQEFYSDTDYKNYLEALNTAKILLEEMDTAGKTFFTLVENGIMCNRLISEQDKIKFQQECDAAIAKAMPVLSKQRGFGEIPIVFRAILGIVAALGLLIGAIIVSCKSKQGYLKTFFGNTTDSQEKLITLQNNSNLFFDKINEGMPEFCDPNLKMNNHKFYPDSYEGPRY